jgi:hypothetical protein
MTPLEALYARLGHPRWFWPAVMAVLLLLVLIGGNDQ